MESSARTNDPNPTASPAEASLEAYLSSALLALLGPQTPPKLAAAMRHAVLGGGSRVRPRLLLAVVRACEGEPSQVARRGTTHAALGLAAAVEFLHCASLVHDDLPCFDNAAMRRGAPTVHCRFGEEIAVLTGDALIVGAFETAERALRTQPALLGPTMAALAQAVGAARGLACGQAWESESDVCLQTYHHAKTSALFVLAAELGALLAGAETKPWRTLGREVGAVYQIADDLLDVAASVETAQKTTGRDDVLGRPSMVAEHGAMGTALLLRQRAAQIGDLVPECRNRSLFLEHLARMTTLVVTRATEHLASANGGHHALPSPRLGHVASLTT